MVQRTQTAIVTRPAQKTAAMATWANRGNAAFAPGMVLTGYVICLGNSISTCSARG